VPRGAKAEFEGMLIDTERAGIVDRPPRSRLRIERPGDRRLVMDLYAVKRLRIGRVEWRRTNPEKMERILETFPRRQET
jgi:hypothetical protein